MKTKRWKCGRCWSKSVERAEDDAFDGRPLYRCRFCGNSYTKGWRGHSDDPQPSNHPSVAGGEA